MRLPWFKKREEELPPLTLGLPPGRPPSLFWHGMPLLLAKALIVILVCGLIALDGALLYLKAQGVDPIAFLNHFAGVADPVGKALPLTDDQGEVVETVEPIAPPAEAVREQIAAAPPKQIATSNTGIRGTTTTHDDGSKTTVVSEGAISQSEFAQVTATNVAPGSPLDVIVEDETGQNAGLIGPLRSYLNSTLRWGSEVSALKKITIRAAGETGWSGQYSGSYTEAPSGDIVSVTGWIILNTTYYQDSPHFQDYMKLTLSHEYGHHYTQYHKWVDGDLGSGERFPDSYYAIRPLSKATTATDYSKGWDYCESEIIAEDYSYLFSGYGYHAMKSALGYPSDPGIRNWLTNIVNNVKSSAIVPNQSPEVSIISPSADATVEGQITITAMASDDRGIAQVRFYIGGQRIAEDTSAPYEATWSTVDATPSVYTIRVVATDTDGITAENSLSVTVRDQRVAETSSPSPPVASETSPTVDIEAPVILISEPATDPYFWTEGNLILRASATDNQAVVKIEFSINNTLYLSDSSDSIAISIRNNKKQAGTYTFTIKAYDAAGNMGEKSIQIVKQ